MIEPTAQIAVTMSAQQWELVLQQLVPRPIAEIMATIKRQCMEHDQMTPRAGNGAESHPEP